jgi:hypothetical protein
MNLTETVTALFAAHAKEYSDAPLALSCLDALSKPDTLPEHPPDDYRDMVAALIMIVMSQFGAVTRCLSTAPIPLEDRFALPGVLAWPLGAREERVKDLFRALTAVSEAARSNSSFTVPSR